MAPRTRYHQKHHQRPNPRPVSHLGWLERIQPPVMPRQLASASAADVASAHLRTQQEPA